MRLAPLRRRNEPLVHLEGDLWMLHVLNERGEVVEGGIGDAAYLTQI
jgi:hypothetical protein